MMMMQYTKYVVKAHKVQTVKLTVYKYKSWWHADWKCADKWC